jgi:hypothetical protein
MNAHFEFSKILRDIVYSTDMNELKFNVQKANEFILKNNISSDSDEYKKIENAIVLMRLKIKKSRKS